MGLARNTVLYFTPNVVSILISFVMVPIATARLGPEEIARIALFNVFGGVLVALTATGFGSIWSTHYLGLADEEKQGFVSTLVIAGVVVIVALGGMTAGTWVFLRGHVSYLADASLTEIGMVVGMAGATAFWFQTQPLLILESQATKLAVIAISSAIISAVTTSVGLFAFELGTKAAFLGSLLGAVASALGALVAVGPYCKLQFSARWLKELLPIWLLRSPTALLDPLSSMAERFLVIGYLSLETLGLYSHSQNYRGALTSALTALDKTLLPFSLNEARLGSHDFPQTRRAWGFGLLMLTMVSLGFAAFGKEFVALLTHGKFDSAAPFVTGWIVLLILQQAGKEDCAVLYTANCNVFLSAVSIIPQLVSLAALFLLIPFWGVWGIFAAMIGEFLLCRLSLRWRASRIRSFRINDGRIGISLVFASAALAIQLSFGDNLAARCAGCALLMAFYALIERSIIASLYRLTLAKLVNWVPRLAVSQDGTRRAA